MHKIYLSLVILLLFSGCIHKPLPNLPENWTGETVNPQALEDKPDVATMQIVIVYGSSVCNHTASRFFCPGKGALFWDPGGGYGSEGIVKVKRKLDVIVGNIPTLNDYLYWRTRIPSHSTEIFVWDSDNKKICEMYDLVAAASKRDRVNGFDSDAAGLFCSTTTSTFLRDYAQDLLNVDKWGLPHNLSKQLHERQSADKIYIVDHASNLIKRYYPK